MKDTYRTLFDFVCRGYPRASGSRDPDDVQEEFESMVEHLWGTLIEEWGMTLEEIEKNRIDDPFPPKAQTEFNNLKAWLNRKKMGLREAS